MNNPYKIIDNISSFTHSIFKEKFRYMNDAESVALARLILDKFILSGYKDIVIIESGTSPLINIIKKLEKYKNSNINFFPVKIPRELDFNLYGWLKTYLKDKELNKVIKINNLFLTRDEWLRRECLTFDINSIIQPKDFKIYDSILDTYKYSLENVLIFHDILKGTQLFKLFNSPFLLFDEYINAGTIIKNFNVIMRLFTANPHFQLSAFCMFLDNPNNYNKIAFTIYDNSNELECYRNGAYPFENRVDLIGYYYFINKDNFQKIYIANLFKYQNKNNKLNVEDFYQLLEESINNNKILDKLKKGFKEEQVKNYVTNDDIKRYIIKYLEKMINGINLYYDLLDQVFEIYAPAWSPMPVKFHLDYWHGFNQIDNEIKGICDNLKDTYCQYRNNIIKDILDMLLNNRKIWLNSINQILEDSNENN